MSRVDDSPWLRNVSRHATPAPALVALAAVLCLPGCTVRDILATEVHPVSPNVGGRIALTSLRDGNWEIYIMGGDGSDPMRLTDDPTHDGMPSWSPDAERIAFVSDRDGNAEIYVMDANGGSCTRLTDHPAVDWIGDWSIAR